MDGSFYVYTQGSAGQYAMRRMRQLAGRGQGLNRYINLSVGKVNDESKQSVLIAGPEPPAKRRLPLMAAQVLLTSHDLLTPLG